MSSSATKKKADADATPNIARAWELTISNNSQLPMLRKLDISFQKSDQTPNLIFGSVDTPPPGKTDYAIENGKIWSNDIETAVAFDVTISGVVHSFTGFYTPAELGGEPIITGKVRSSQKISGGPKVGGTEEGSWSAKATGGDDEEENPLRRQARALNRSIRGRTPGKA